MAGCNTAKRKWPQLSSIPVISYRATPSSVREQGSLAQVSNAPSPRCFSLPSRAAHASLHPFDFVATGGTLKRCHYFLGRRYSLSRPLLESLLEWRYNPSCGCRRGSQAALHYCQDNALSFVVNAIGAAP